jgi:hypothetical protein
MGFSFFNDTQAQARIKMLNPKLENKMKEKVAATIDSNANSKS